MTAELLFFESPNSPVKPPEKPKVPQQTTKVACPINRGCPRNPNGCDMSRCPYIRHSGPANGGAAED